MFPMTYPTVFVILYLMVRVIIYLMVRVILYLSCTAVKRASTSCPMYTALSLGRQDGS